MKPDRAKLIKIKIKAERYFLFYHHMYYYYNRFLTEKTSFYITNKRDFYIIKLRLIERYLRMTEKPK